MGVYHTIHTLELQRKIPLGEVSRWRGRLYELSERYGTGVYSKSKDEQEFYMYAQKGVTINLRAAVNCGFIKLTINLNSVLYAEPQRVVLFCPDKNYLGIFDRNLREILRDAGLGEAEEFEFSRVDFSANAKVDDPLAYIALARKSGVPNGYQETYPRFDNKKRNKPIKYAYSFDLTHNREDYAVTLYSKADQLKDDRNAELRDIQAAQGLLRFEAKYGAPMLKTYIGMHDLHYSKEKLYDLLSSFAICPAQSNVQLLSGGYLLFASGGAKAARSGCAIKTARAAFEMDRGNLAYEQRLQGTAKGSAKVFPFRSVPR